MLRGWRRTSRRAFGEIAVVLVLAPPAAAFEGRYLGTYQETDAAEDFRAFEHRTDLTGRRLLAPNVDGTFGASLRYTTEPGRENADLFRSRLFGDARGSLWRLHGQWLPWQDRSPGPTPPRQEELDLGGETRWPGVASLSADWTRSVLENLDGHSSSDSKRVQIDRAWSDVHTLASWRRIETEPSAFALAAPTRNVEWRGAAGWDRAWRNASLSFDTDALLSQFRERERSRDFHAETAEGTGSWRVARKTTLGATGMLRTGATKDNALPSARDLDERALSLRAEHRPFSSLVLEGSREYRKRQDSAGDTGTDYFRLGARFVHQVIRATTFQTGYQRSVDVGGGGEEVPRNDAWATVESRVRRGINARAEVRTEDAAVGTENRLWRSLGQLTLQPTTATRLDASWTRQTLPEIGGVGQHEREWVLTESWNPGRASFVSSFRRLNGSGRIERTERSWALTSSVPMPRGGDVHFDALRRATESFGLSSSEDAWGAGVTARLPQDSRLLANWRRVTRTGQPVVLSGALTLEVKFGRGDS
jgi:hypothetical protein